MCEWILGRMRMLDLAVLVVLLLPWKGMWIIQQALLSPNSLLAKYVMRDITNCLRNVRGQPTSEALHISMWKKGCRTGNEASHKTIWELVVKSLSTHKRLHQKFGCFSFFARRTGTESGFCWQKYGTLGCEEYFLILLLNITTLPKPRAQDEPYTGRSQQNLYSCPLHRPVTSKKSRSTGYNVNRWLTCPTSFPLFKTTRRASLGNEANSHVQ